MRKYNTNSNKSDGFTTSPVTVELNGRSIEAVHHFTNQTDTLLNLYIDTREGGIDVVIPLASDKPAYALSERGEEVLGFTEDTHDCVDDVVPLADEVTDEDCSDARDVRYEYTIDEVQGTEYAFHDDEMQGSQVLGILKKMDDLADEILSTDDPIVESNGRREYVRLSKQLPASGAGDERTDENAELVTDGGYDIARSTGIAIERTDCNLCGDLLLDTAILFTIQSVPPTLALEADWWDWHTSTAPSAQCGTCSARVRSIAVVAAVWRARSRPLTYDTDESDDPNADRELMTDGGEPIDNESDESGNVSKDDFEGVDIEGASNEVNQTHDRDENDDADDGADDNGDWDVGDMDLSFPPESDDTHDRVEYAEHPPVDLPGAGPYTPAFTDVDVTPVGDGDE